MGTLLAFFLVYIVYFIFTISRYDKNGHYKDRKYNYEEKLRQSKKKKDQKKIVNEVRVKDLEKLPNEVKYFVYKYKIDLEKVNIRGLLKLSGITLALCIAISIIIIVLGFKVRNYLLQIILCFVITMILYLISMKLLGNYFKKRGLVKDDE